MEVVHVCWITLVLFLRAVAACDEESKKNCFDGEGKDLTKEDFEAFEKNVVVLKNKIDVGFEQISEPIDIEGKSFIGDLTIFTRGDQCMQLLTLEPKDGSFQDSVKMSCDLEVSEDTDMKSAGIQIGGIVKEGDGYTVFYSTGDGQCVQRSYATETTESSDTPLTGGACPAELTGGKGTGVKHKKKVSESTSDSSKTRPTQENTHTFRGNGKDLIEEDFEKLKNNLVVLKNKIDDGFAPAGDAKHIQGMGFTATVTKYTQGDQCFQLVTLVLKEASSVQDSVKISCVVDVPDADMSSTGITISGLIKEGDDNSVYYETGKGRCMHRYYGTEGIDNLEFSLPGEACAEMTHGEIVGTTRGSPSFFGSVSSKKIPSQYNRNMFDGDGMEMTDDDFEALKDKLVVLKNHIDDGFEPDGDMKRMQGRFFTATLTKFTRGEQCFQLLTMKPRDAPVRDSVKIPCDVGVPLSGMITSGIKIGGMVKEGYSNSVYYVNRKGRCVHRYYSTDPDENIDYSLTGDACAGLVGEDTPSPSDNSNTDNRHRWAGYGEDMTDEDFQDLKNKLVVLKNKIDDGFAPEGDPINLEGMSFTATLTKYTKEGKCFQLLTLVLKDDTSVQDSVKISCDVGTPQTEMSSTGLVIVGVFKEGDNDSVFFAIGNRRCMHRYYGTKPIDNLQFSLPGGACAEMTNRDICG